MARAPSTKGNTSPINDHIGTAYDSVKLVADNIDSVNNVSGNLIYLNHYLGVYASAPSQAPTGEAIENNDFYVNSTDKSMNYYSDGSWIQFSLDYEDFSAKVALAVSSSETAVSEAQTATEQANIAYSASVNSSTSAASAADSASEAQGYLGQVSADAVAATDSANAAKISEDNAKVSEDNAKASETAAQGYMVQSSTSAATATTKASEASDSALDASVSSSEAEGYATDLETAVQTTTANATTASNAATTATTKASEASASATAANTSKSSAAASATNAATSATLASDKAEESSTSASLATDKATVATTKAQEAVETYNAVAQLFDQFGDQYLGSLSADPTVDNDGDPLQNGAFYWNNTESELRFYTGSVWVSPESVASEYANQAQQSAASASTSADAAEQSNQSALASKNSASSSATLATTKASEASSSATESADSASAAATSESNASVSESNASASESAASASATNAASSASQASSSATSASSSASVSSTKATEASASASSAATSESNAEDSAQAAAQSETNAASSASSAASSATSASGSASTATTKASEASASATSASGSASAAESHKDDAETAYNSTQALFDSFDTSVAGSVGKIALPEPLVDLPFDNTIVRKLSGDLEFSRSTGYYYTNKSGLMDYADVDEPAITSDGVWLHGSYTNIVSDSEDISQSSWTKNTGASVEGTDGILLKQDTSYLRQNIPLTSYTAGDKSYLSFLVRKGDGDYLKLTTYFALGFAGGTYSVLDLDNKTVTVNNTFMDIILETVHINDVEWVWVKARLTYNTSSYTSIIIQLGNSDSSGGSVSVPDNPAFYVTKFSLTETSSILPYVPSGSAAPTTCTVPVENNMPAAGESFTIVCDADVPDNPATVWCADEASVFTLRRFSSGADIVFRYQDSLGTTKTLVADYSLTVGIKRYIVAYNKTEGTLSLYCDGELCASSIETEETAKNLLIFSSSYISLGGPVSSIYLNSQIKNFKIYHSAFTAEQVAALGSAE